MRKITYNWEVLAITRFYLAMVVLFSHLPATLMNDTSRPWYGRLGAFEAVLGFLLISGLSIGMSIQRNQDSYFKRRLQRIYPVYLVSIVIHYLVVQDQITTEFVVLLVLNLLFLNQIFTTLSYVIVAWSLSLEVWLYALAPYLYRLSFKALMVIIYISFVAFLIHIAGRTLFHWPYYAGVSAGLNLIVLGFIWVAGFVYSIYPEKRKFMAINVAIFFASYFGLTLLIELLHQVKHHEAGDFINHDLIYYTLQLLTLAIVFVVVFYNHKVTYLSLNTKKVFNVLGNISYPLYLTHRSVFMFLHKYNIHNIGLGVFATLFIAWLVYVLFDFYSKKRPLAKTPVAA